MTNIKKDKKEQFDSECKLINLGYEYKGYTGREKWAIVSKLSEKELLEKYPDEVREYVPFVLLSIGQGEIINEYNRVEHKHNVRNKLYHDNYNTSDDVFEIYHPELITDTLLEEVVSNERIEQLKRAIDELTPTQKRRIQKYYFAGKSLRKIADEEGVVHTKIQKSIVSAIGKLKKLLS